MSKLSIIAIDGPSGVGKSTTAKRVAQELGWDYLDTGAMYRATALALQRAGMALDDRPGLERVLARAAHPAARQPRVPGRRGRERGHPDPGDHPHGDAGLGRRPGARSAGGPAAADRRAQGGWVVDGRDIGTVVFPDACCKIFLTASCEARAGRRYRELADKGVPLPLDEVAADLQRRDLADSTRAVSPLRRAEDAVELDSSGMGLDEVVAWIVARHRGHAAGASI